MTLREVFSSIANAIRSKTGKTETIKPVDMATEIESIQTSGVFNRLPQVVDNTITIITADDLAGATKVRSSAFQDCTELTSITLPDSVTRIVNNAFYNCRALTSITLSDNLESISVVAFQGCSALTQITIPAKVTSIGHQALQIGSSTNKATITMKPTTPPTITSGTFKADYLNKIIVPAGCGDAYKSATNWSNFADYIEEATA